MQTRSKLLVSLVSDQTIPNVQLIKKYKEDSCDFLMVSTESMHKKGTQRWIEEAAGIRAVDTIYVKEYDQEDILAQLDKYDFSSYSELIVNITGGTKIMTLALYNFFQNKSATTIYYLPGKNNILDLLSKKSDSELNVSITLEEYLKAYGFTIQKSTSPEFDFEYTCEMFQYYCNGVLDNFPQEVAFLREKRNDGVKIKDFAKIKALLDAINYKPNSADSLDKYEVKYLTGEWFEEYIGGQIKKALDISAENILVGAKILKLPTTKEVNPIHNLLGFDPQMTNPNENEIDVMFIHNEKLHVIECKTSIIDTRVIDEYKKNKAGQIMQDESGKPIIIQKTKQANILGETIYKSDSLKTNFGLFAQSYIFTLTDLKIFIKDDLNRKKRMIDLINRASNAGIKLVAQEQIKANTETIQNLLKII